MLSRIDERGLVNQIEELQQQKEIENLLRRKKKLTSTHIKDPVHNQLYVEWEEGFVAKKRVKTEANLTSKMHVSRLDHKASGNLSNNLRHRKNYSQSVQLPKISKRIAPPQVDMEENRRSFVLPAASKATSKAHLAQALSRRNRVGTTSFQTKNNTIDSQEELATNRQQQKPIKGLKLNLGNKFKLAKMGKNGEAKSGKTKMNKEWLKLNILKMDTYFYKLKKIKREESKNPVEVEALKDPSQLEKMYVPPKEKVPDFIRTYKPVNPDIDINELVKDITFHVVHEENESLYFGQSGAGSKTKTGILVTKNLRFEGQWRNDQKYEGFEINSQGFYNGSFKQSRRHGPGEFFWKNGQFYSGDWVKGMKHGSGMWKSGKGDTYIGQWQNGKVEGSGVHTSSTGQRYEGEFKQFLKWGLGRETFPNGDTYEGEYRKGKPHGKGKYVWKNGVVYEGQFSNGFRQGSGKIIAKGYLQFQGTFQKERPEKHGILKYDNGDEYEGEFSRGDRHGVGIMKLKEERKIMSGVWRFDSFEFEKEQPQEVG